MKNALKRKIFYELLWLVVLIVISALAEYAVITFFDLHPVVSVKIQGLLGLIVFGYLIRMISRMIKKGVIKFDDEDDYPTKSD